MAKKKSLSVCIERPAHLKASKFNPRNLVNRRASSNEEPDQPRLNYLNVMRALTKSCLQFSTLACILGKNLLPTTWICQPSKSIKTDRRKLRLKTRKIPLL